MEIIKDKMKSQRDELSRYREMYEEKCQQVETLREIKNKTENMAETLGNRITGLETENAQLEGKLQTTVEKWQEAVKTIEEYERFRKAHEIKGKQDGDKILVLENRIKSTKAIAEDSERKVEEVRSKLTLAEMKLEKTEAQLEAAVAKLQSRDIDINVLKANLKVAELNVEKMTELKEEDESAIKKLTARIREAEYTIDTLSRQLRYRQADLDRVEDALANSQLQYRALRDEMDSCLRDLKTM